MQSAVIRLPAGVHDPWPDQGAVAGGRPPDAVLAFLPGGDRCEALVERIEASWPEAIRFGCEAVTQFSESGLATSGTLQLFWFEGPGHGVEVTAVEPGVGGRLSVAVLEDAARRIQAADTVTLIADGLRFPTQALLAELRRRCPDVELPIAGGLASAPLGGEPEGARVFLNGRVYPSACLLVCWRGVRATVEIVRGWSAASPVYTVTRADGNVLHEIDGEPATDWFRRFFTVDGRLAGMPEAAHSFPLIIEGPDRDRQGIYRSMREFDSPEGAVTFWGDLQVGDEVRLAMGNDASLVETAAALASGRRADAAMLYSCVGREIVLGERAEAEVASIHEALGGLALSGFFTFGEIGPTATGTMAFYNHTAVLVLLSEATP